jgi:hypothetical protein
MLWGLPIWVWIVFFVSRIFWIAAGSILWVYFFEKKLWNKEIEEKYFSNSSLEKTDGEE